MTNQQLETFLFQYTESEQRHLREQPPQLSPRYRNIPKVVYNGREMYQFNFGSLLKNRSVCVNKESRFTVIPEHIHSVIECLYVYSGHCTQIINGQSIQMAQGDICMLDTHVPHSIQPLGKNDIVITIEMKKEYLTQGFLQRLGNNGIINGFLINALSSEAAHDQYLLFHNREETPIHAVIQSILCESYDPQICGDKMIDAYMIVLFCKILRQYRSQSFSPKAKSQWKIVDILDGSKLSNRHLAEHRRPFWFPSQLSQCFHQKGNRAHLQRTGHPAKNVPGLLLPDEYRFPHLRNRTKGRL